jgi:Family of unknown function (DUF6079)
MRRIQEKVKDLVEVRSYKSLRDFISDPSQTLAAYHFTDVTAEMMAKWLGSVSEVQPQYGMAKALAGYRGVGKSHFLATLGAVVSNPELRSRITEPYVAASAQRLKRRRHPVAHVRRGTHDTLLDELKDSVAETFDMLPKELGDSLTDILESAAQRSGDLPFVLIIDTAYDRAARVARDDGGLLGEIAEIAKRTNIFVGVALDDDITGADGINAAIARNYTIDYLDQEHLYRIVETEIFPKQRQTQHLIHELYSGFREVIPSFRWSEQRFTSLYPLHPVILEAAPYIRLYAPEFAMLGFASEAGAKVLGRPANSLVALDEVFDRVEPSLRKAKDLQEAFAAYDFLNTEVVSMIPVMERLQAKLILKALMILSLDGEGATAAEIGAAMLVYNENDIQSGIQSVENLLETFVSVSPDKVNRFAQENRETRFGLKVSGKDDLNKRLLELTKELSPNAVEKVLRRHARERFQDWILQTESSSADTVDCQLVWRGGYRRGRIAWNWERRGGANALLNPEAAEFLDWEVIVCHPQNKDAANLSQSDLPLVVWQPAALRADEEATILRYSVLLTNENLREDYGEQVRAAGHTHQLAVEKIWNRIFIEEGKLLIDGFQHSFSETAKSAQMLSEMLSQMLTPLFELRYPQHPFFDRPLGMSDVAHLVSEHFSGAKQTLPEVQELARTFALPLGLVTKQGNNYILESDEMLMRLPITQRVMSFVGQNAKETVPLKAVYNSLRREPNGLLREAQHLVLAALVAQRKIEFITAKGDRINRRSLDLKIIWDDIIGISSPLTHLYASNVLTDWAKVLTGDNSFRTIDDPADCEKITRVLENWLAEWKSRRLLERFEELSDDVLTTKIWRISTTVQKTFGTIAASIQSLLEGGISLEECLQRIVDAFSDSREEFLICSNKVTMLEDFVNAVALRKKVWSYLAICESSHDENIEGLHTTLLELTEKLTENPRASHNRELEILWQSFHAKFSEHFAIKHDTIMKSHHLQEKFDEIMRGDEWWEFENLSSLPIFQQKYWQEARKIHRQFRELDCHFNVREMLVDHPFCACSFRLSQTKEWENLPERMRKTIEEGRKSYRKTIALMTNTLVPLLLNHAQNERLAEYSQAAANLANLLAGGQELRLLNNVELIVLGKVFQSIPSAPLLQVAFPTDGNFVSREDLRARLTDWLDKLPDDPCLLKI